MIEKEKISSVLYTPPYYIYLTGFYKGSTNYIIKFSIFIENLSKFQKGIYTDGNLWYIMSFYVIFCHSNKVYNTSHFLKLILVCCYLTLGNLSFIMEVIK